MHAGKATVCLPQGVSCCVALEGCVFLVVYQDLHALLECAFWRLPQQGSFGSVHCGSRHVCRHSILWPHAGGVLVLVLSHVCLQRTGHHQHSVGAAGIIRLACVLYAVLSAVVGALLFTLCLALR